MDGPIEIKTPQPLAALPDERTPRQIKLQMTDAEYAAVMEALTPERRRDVWLTEAARITGHRLAVSLPAKHVTERVRGYAENDLGMQAVIETDDDLCSWTLQMLNGLLFEDEARSARVDGDRIIIRGDSETIRQISLHFA